MSNYALSVNYGNLSAGNQPLSDFDTTNGQLAAMGTLMCAATGTNTVSLASLAGYPTMTAYGNLQKVGFTATASSTTLVSIGYSALSVLNAYLDDGVTRVGSTATNGLVSGTYYEFAYNSTLNLGAGGWQSIGGSVNTSNIGEFITATAADGSISVVANTPKTVASVALSAGEWDIWGVIRFTPHASTTISQILGGIGTTTDDLSGVPTAALFAFNAAFQSGAELVQSTPVVRVTIAAPATYYLVSQCNFGVSTMTVGGVVNASRAVAS